MKIVISSWIVMLTATAFARLHWVAEDCVVNREAMVKNSHAGNHWNLWSTDKDADKKWSGGVMLQSPRVMVDRERPEEGAPPLHLCVKDSPAGNYMLAMKTGRVLGLSLDGKTWRRWKAGDTIQVDVRKTSLEWWIDDRYAMDREDYLSNIMRRVLPTFRDPSSRRNHSLVENTGSAGFWNTKGLTLRARSATGSVRAPSAGAESDAPGQRQNLLFA